MNISAMTFDELKRYAENDDSIPALVALARRVIDLDLSEIDETDREGGMFDRYDEGYDVGYGEGYDEGYEEGAQDSMPDSEKL